MPPPTLEMVIEPPSDCVRPVTLMVPVDVKFISPRVSSRWMFTTPSLTTSNDPPGDMFLPMNRSTRLPSDGSVMSAATVSDVISTSSSSLSIRPNSPSVMPAAALITAAGLMSIEGSTPVRSKAPSSNAPILLMAVKPPSVSTSAPITMSCCASSETVP